MTAVDPGVVASFAPTGRLRVAVNLANTVLVERDPTTGAIGGRAVELARLLASRLDVALDICPFKTAGEIFRALPGGTWDIAFIADDPARTTIDFSPPLLTIEGTYMVAAESPIRRVADADRPGNRIAVSLGSSVDLSLSQSLRAAELVRADPATGLTSLRRFLDENLDALAGGREILVDYAGTMPNMRVIDDCFMQIRQAIGMPKGRESAMNYLRTFVEQNRTPRRGA